MSDLDAFMAQFGIVDGPAAQAYRTASSFDELYAVAGERLLEHARAVATAVFPVADGGLFSLFRRALTSREVPPRSHAGVVVFAALLDLCEVRGFFSGHARGRADAISLQRIYAAALSLDLSLRRGVPDEEKAVIREMGQSFGDLFFEDPTVHADVFERQIWKVRGSDQRQADMAGFIRLTAVERTWLEPAALLQHFERLSG